MIPKLPASQYVIGDFVWLLQPGIRTKLQQPWNGPYQVTDIPGPTTYTIQCPTTGKSQTVHFNRLKLSPRLPLLSSPQLSSNTSDLSSTQDASNTWPDDDNGQPVLPQAAPMPQVAHQRVNRNAPLPARYRNWNFHMYR